MPDNDLHNLGRVSVAAPRLCVVCDDYIVTPRCTAHQCFTCGQLFHAVCVRRGEQCPGSLTPRTGDGPNNVVVACEASAHISLSDQPLANWTLAQVLQWLVVVGLSRYTTLFLSHNINGATLPILLKHPSQLDDIKDAFARCCVKRAVMTLTGELPIPGDRELDSPKKETQASPQHTCLYLRNFTREMGCCVCGLALLGLTYQGYQCNACGRVFHRTCRLLCEEHPPCVPITSAEMKQQLTSDYEDDSFDNSDDDLYQRERKLPTATPLIRNSYFSLLLEQQITDSEDVPVFLSTCTRIFEQLATSNAHAAAAAAASAANWASRPMTTAAPTSSMVNCVEAYRVSASGRQLRRMEAAYADRLPTDLEDDGNDSEDNGDGQSMAWSETTATTTTTTAVCEQKLFKLAQLIKRFLRDLPEPVIPTRLYQKTIDLASDTEKTQQDRYSALESLLTSMPKRHLTTLRHVMHHIGFILCHQRVLKVRTTQATTAPATALSGDEIERLDDPRLVLSIFAQILLRPPWRDCLKLALPENHFGHLKALEFLFEYFVRPRDGQATRRDLTLPPRSTSNYECYAELLVQSGEVAPLYRSPPLTPTLTSSGYRAVAGGGGGRGAPTAQSAARNKRDLEDHDWYWGDISRSDVSEIMQGQPDGAFLVRDASAESASAFTLTERRNFNIILFRIYHCGDFFDITNPPSPGFPLVSALVAHYQQLAAQTSLDASTPRLLHPVVRHSGLADLPSTAVAGAAHTGGAEGIIQSLLSKLRSTSSELNRVQAQVNQLNRSSAELMHEMAATTNQMRALTRSQAWLKKGSAQCSRNLESLSSASQELFAKYRSMYSTRLHRTQAVLLSQVKQHNNLLDSICKVCENQVVLVSQQDLVGRRMQEIRRELKRRGVSDEVIFACDGVGSVASTTPVGGVEGDSPLQAKRESEIGEGDRSAWFRNISREEAELLLSNVPSGTFLVRPSTVENRYALSVRAGVYVQHCLIFCVNGFYGFASNLTPFTSLEDLVAHYRVTSLVQHNALLDTTLRNPAFVDHRAAASPPSLP